MSSVSAVSPDPCGLAMTLWSYPETTDVLLVKETKAEVPYKDPVKEFYTKGAYSSGFAQSECKPGLASRLTSIPPVVRDSLPKHS